MPGSSPSLHPRTLTLLPLVLAVSLVLPAPPVRAAAVTSVGVDAGNPHYLDVNGAATPLIGLSGDFLSHVSRPAKLNTVCTFDKIPPALTQYSYVRCLNNLQSSGLNKMQVVIALNSSPGFDDPNTGSSPVGGPYPAEQPVVWDGNVANPKWHLDQYDDLGYFANLNQVIRDAATRGIVVEIVLVDQWDGNSAHGPWDPGRNYGGAGGLSAGFTSTQKRLVTSYESGTTDTTAAIQRARTLQKSLIAHVVAKLSANANLYWEISNEADLVPSGPAPDLTGLVNWHNDIATIISSNDPKHHPIGVNFVTQDVLGQVLAGNLPKVQIVNGHYAQVSNSTGQISYGALPMERAYLNGTVGNLTQAFGFNESKASPDPAMVGTRAEAWEFMLNEGAAYDDYNLGPFDTRTTTIRQWLTRLNSFLQPFLPYFGNSQFVRNNGASPGWATGLSTPGTHTAEDVALGQTYWAAMNFRRQEYGLYVHHGCLAGSGQQRYKPLCKSPVGYQETLQLIPGSLAGFFKVEWFVPDQDAPVCTQLLNWLGTGSVPVISPKYAYDIALRLTRCADATCATVTDCSTMTASFCPTSTWPDTGACS